MKSLNKYFFVLFVNRVRWEIAKVNPLFFLHRKITGYKFHRPFLQHQCISLLKLNSVRSERLLTEFEGKSKDLQLIF